MNDFIPTHHGNGVGGQQLLGTHGRDVGDVGEDVDEGHQGDGDEDGPRKVPGNGERMRQGFKGGNEVSKLDLRRGISMGSMIIEKNAEGDKEM